MTENKLLDPQKSSFGMDANKAVLIFWLAAGLLMLYPFVAPVAFIVPLIFLLKEKESSFVRFHAFQCMIYAIIFAIINIPIGILSILPLAIDKSQQTADVRYCPIIKVDFLPYLVGILFLLIAALVISKSMSYEAYKLPVAGPMAEKKYLAD